MLARGRLSFPLCCTDGVKAALPVGLQPWGRKQHAEPAEGQRSMPTLTHVVSRSPKEGLVVTPEGKGALCTEAELATKPASFSAGGKEATRSEGYLVPKPWHLPHPGASIFLLVPPGPPESGVVGGNLALAAHWSHVGSRGPASVGLRVWPGLEPVCGKEFGLGLGQRSGLCPGF